MVFVANFIRFPAVQKSVKIWQSYREFKGGNFLTHSVYTRQLEATMVDLSADIARFIRSVESRMIHRARDQKQTIHGQFWQQTLQFRVAPDVLRPEIEFDISAGFVGYVAIRFVVRGIQRCITSVSMQHSVLMQAACIVLPSAWWPSYQLGMHVFKRLIA